MLKPTSKFKTPSLGKKVFELPSPWKPSGMGWTPYGIVFCACNNDSRRHSRIYLNWSLLHEDDGKKSTNETIGNPLVFNGNEVLLVGENGKLFHWNGASLLQKHSTAFASAATIWRNELFWFDTKDGEIHARDINGIKRFKMPGSGIVLSAAAHSDGHLYCAIADADNRNHGIASSEGWLTKFDNCQCAVSYHGLLAFSVGNKIHIKDQGVQAELPCDKIMDMKVADNMVWIAGDNPACLYVANMRGDFVRVGEAAGSAKVGGSCFRVRTAVNDKGTKGYFAAAPKGNTTAVYEIVWR